MQLSKMLFFLTALLLFCWGVLLPACHLAKAALHIHPAIHENFLAPPQKNGNAQSGRRDDGQTRSLITAQQQQYQPTWESLDTRPLPTWYDDVKVGIFIHWGVFAVPAFGSEWFWYNWKGPKPDNNTVNYVERNYPPNFAYGDFARDLKAQWFDADEWIDLFVKSGAKYIVPTAKHHEGYCMWNSSYCWQWNAMAVGPQRDVIGELAAAVKARPAKDGMHFGLYHSLFEWFNPLWEEDLQADFKTNRFASQKTMPELYELVEKYSPEVVWSDGDWGAPDTYWNSTEFLAWLVNESPVRDTVVFNDRWGASAMCKHGSFWTCEDRFDPGKLIPHKWENCMTLDRQSWGYRRNMKIVDIIPIAELISLMVRTVSCGGNILINVGPTEDGIIAPIFQERLLQLGQWLKVNGDAIYSTQPYTSQNDSYSSNVWYTAKKSSKTLATLNDAVPKNEISPFRQAQNDIVFAIILGNTTNSFTNIVGITLGSIPFDKIEAILVLGNSDRKVIWKQSQQDPQGTDVMLPPLDGAPEVLQWATVLQISIK